MKRSFSSALENEKMPKINKRTLMRRTFFISREQNDLMSRTDCHRCQTVPPRRCVEVQPEFLLCSLSEKSVFAWKSSPLRDRGLRLNQTPKKFLTIGGTSSFSSH